VADVIPLGRRLREHREHLGMSQAQAARELDVARTAYRLWELEAARPSSDRWRTISRWLGISVAALLLSEELTEIEGADEVERIAHRLQEQSTYWDAGSGDYFLQERAAIRDQARRGAISSAESDRLSEMLRQIEGANPAASTTTWQSAEFHKELVGGAKVVEEARAALAVTASGIPTEAMEAADELLAALLADPVAASDGSPTVIGVHIEVGRHALRVVASDPVADGGSGADGPGWRFVMNHATRWGATGRGGVRARWFELELPEPGTGTTLPLR
jgi:transcriptional regulator with XRE-family HTH domain